MRMESLFYQMWKSRYQTDRLSNNILQKAISSKGGRWPIHCLEHDERMQVLLGGIECFLILTSISMLDNFQKIAMRSSSVPSMRVSNTYTMIVLIGQRFCLQ